MSAFPEYEWAAPAGAYRVPSSWQDRFLAEFPDYRVRWSLRWHRWQIEQRAGAGALPPVSIRPFDDSLIRATDGYWLVMETQPGSRMGCEGFVQDLGGRRQRCGWTLPVPLRRSQEVVCPICRAKQRDGRTRAAYWPFDEALLEHLRFTDPLRDGTRQQRIASDQRNAALEAAAARDHSNRNTSLDAVDYRWISGIPSTSGRTRRTIDEKDLL